MTSITAECATVDRKVKHTGKHGVLLLARVHKLHILTTSVCTSATAYGPVANNDTWLQLA